jgi:hypothetical protein
MSLIQNERTKLTANWLNAMASGVIVTGVVAPSIALMFQLGGSALLNLWLIGAASCTWLLGGVILHLTARYILRSLR